MSAEETKKNTNEKPDPKEKNDCNDGCCCNIFDYKRPSEDDAQKTKRKTCC